METCINCSKEVSTSFCGNCGQPNPPKKLTFGNMWYDFQSRIYGFDGMFPRTLRDLTIRPGLVAREHIKGNRVKHYGPVGYFFLMVTVFLLIMSMLDIDFIEFNEMSASGLADTPENQTSKKAMQKLTSIMFDNMRSLSFMVAIPVTLMAWLFFRKAGHNILEHAVLPFYVLGHIYWVTILSLPFFVIFGIRLHPTVSLIISILFFAFACSDFYTHNSRIKAFVKGIAVYIIGYLLFAALMIVLVLVYASIDPEFKEIMRQGK